MKRNVFVLVILSIAVICCQKNEKLAELRFCADILASEPCVGQDTIFPRGTDVWAQLLLSEEYRDTAVIGNLYGYQSDKWVFIEKIVHPLDENERIVMEALFLNLCGNFKVEFFDTKGNLLAKNGFQIL